MHSVYITNNCIKVVNTETGFIHVQILGNCMITTDLDQISFYDDSTMLFTTEKSDISTIELDGVPIANLQSKTVNVIHQEIIDKNLLT